MVFLRAVPAPGGARRERTRAQLNEQPHAPKLTHREPLPDSGYSTGSEAANPNAAGYSRTAVRREEGNGDITAAALHPKEVQPPI